MSAESSSLSDDVVRLLANAANALRLYPPSSPLPAEAVQRFVRKANEATTTLGPLRYIVDPDGFRMGDDKFGTGQSTVLSLAEALHAMQVGQLIIAPDLDTADATAFLRVAGTDPAEIRQRGVREALASAGISRIAVIPVTLRVSEEEGILGLDLATAPLDEMGRETLAAADRWYQSASDGEGRDDMRVAIDRLELATREIATARVAEALMHLDENSRMRILAMSLRADNSGARMSGMMDVLARMRPAALARLLRIVAAHANTEASRVAAALNLPPELAAQVAMLLTPSERSDEESGVPSDVDTEGLAADVGAEVDEVEVKRQITASSLDKSAGRALSTAVAVSRAHPTVEAVEAIADILPSAAAAGAFLQLREAVRRVEEMSQDATLVDAVGHARAVLSDPELLAKLVQAPKTDADAAIAGEVLAAAGPAGADALLGYYVRATEHQRSLMGPVIRGMGDSLLNAASRRMRTDNSQVVIAIVQVLQQLGEKRAVSVIEQGLEHLDVNVRRAAITALADMPGGEGKASLSKALGHWDPETKRHAIREIGRVGAKQALSPLVRILDDINVLERNHELKKEVIKSLESLGSAEALPVLRRWANRRFVFGRKNKELRYLARRAIDNLSVEETNKGDSQ